MTDYSKIRDAVKSVYQSQKWYTKVDSWKNSQVLAVYLRFKRENRL